MTPSGSVMTVNPFPFIQPLALAQIVLVCEQFKLFLDDGVIRFQRRHGHGLGRAAAVGQTDRCWRFGARHRRRMGASWS